MRALVFHGPGTISLDDVPKPVVRDAGDAIVRIVYTTICGTDLHILKGDVPTCEAGRVLGHEGVGVVEELDVLLVGILAAAWRSLKAQAATL